MVQQDHNWQNKASLKKVKKEINWTKVWSNNKTNLGHFAVRYWKICLYAYISNKKWQKLGNECYCKDWFSFPIQIMELGFHETVSYSCQSMFLCKAVVFGFCFPFIHDFSLPEQSEQSINMWELPKLCLQEKFLQQWQSNSTLNFQQNFFDRVLIRYI